MDLNIKYSVLKLAIGAVTECEYASDGGFQTSQAFIDEVIEVYKRFVQLLSLDE
jgi:hypothetical protein